MPQRARHSLRADRAGYAAVKFREHRGSINDSLETLVELADRPALVEHIRKALIEPLNIPGLDRAVDHLLVTSYYPRYDHRTEWPATYIVTVPGLGPVGYTDQPVRKE